MLELIVYSRRGCHLCEDLLLDLEPLCQGRAVIAVRDIDTNDEWLSEYDTAVPVLCYKGREICRYHLDRGAVNALLATEI